MKITIAEKLRPFSHTPGAACVLPGTNWEVEAYPTLLRIGEEKVELRWELKAPISEFTLQQDLEKDCVWVFGKSKEGVFRLKVQGSDSGIEVLVDRAPAKGLGPLKAKETLKFPFEIKFFRRERCERLSLGSHKSQNWDLVKRRGDLRELLPVLFALGQKVPYVVAPHKLTGTARLLELPQDRNEVAAALEKFFKAAFSKMLVPRLSDDEHQGLVPDEPVEGDRFYLIQQGGKMVRDLFFVQTERRLKLLPQLPPSLDAGRMIGLQAPGIGEIDLEWSKKALRRLILRADTSGDAILELPKGLKRYRVRENVRSKGIIQDRDEPLRLEAKKIYFLDNFQK